MSKDEIIQQALQDMDNAQALRAEADKLDYNARMRLADVYLPTSPQKGTVITLAQRAVERRMQKAFK